MMFAATMLLAVPTTTYAQLGGLKKAVKSNTSKPAANNAKASAGKAKSAAGKAGEVAKANDMLMITYPTIPGSENTVTVSGMSKFDIDKVYEPSAAAKANDPMATDTTTEKGFTRSIGQIHAAYEHLNPDWFPQPYWENAQFYYMNDEDSKALHKNSPTFLQTEINKMPSDKEYRVTYAHDQYKGATKTGWLVPRGYTTIQANFAHFLADPLSYQAVVEFIDAHQLVVDRQKGYYEGMHLPGSDDSNIIYKKSGFNQELGRMQFTKGQWAKMQDEADLFCIGVLNQKVPFKVLEDAMKVKLLQYRHKGKTDWWKATYLRQIEVAWPLFDNHPGNTKSGDYEKMLEDYNGLMAQRDAIYEAGKVASQNAIKLEKTVKKDAAFKNKVLAMGKEKLPNEKIEDVVFFNADWELFKSSEWPYPVTQRSQRVGFIFKKNGVYMIDRYDLIQYRQGNMNSNVFDSGKLAHPMGINGPVKVEYPVKK